MKTWIKIQYSTFSIKIFSLLKKNEDMNTKIESKGINLWNKSDKGIWKVEILTMLRMSGVYQLGCFNELMCG